MPKETKKVINYAKFEIHIRCLVGGLQNFLLLIDEFQAVMQMPIRGK